MDYKTKYNIAVNLIENGYLIHCTDNIFNKFNPSFIKGGGRAKEGYGFYFSDMPYKSIDYGKNWKVIKKDNFNFLDSNTPININSFKNHFESDLINLEDELNNVRTNREYERITKEIESIKDTYNNIGGRELFNNIELTIKKYNAKTIGNLEYLIPNPNVMVPKLTKLYVYLGYDGYVTDGIYTVFNFEKLNDMVENIDITKYNLTESLDLSSFKIQNKLNPKFWKNDLLDSRIRLKLLDIADDFTDFLKVDWVKPEDIIMTGSLANYNWSEEYSDIDLHIIMDFKKVDKRVDFVREYFQSKKDLWNQKHKDIRILEYPVELYVQDKNEPHSSSGIYSLEKNDWIVKPERKEPTKKNLNQAEKDAEKWMNKIDSLIDRYYPDEIESEKERILKKLDNTFSKIKDSRRQGFSKKNDEMNKNNLTFKMLRRNGYLDKLSKKKNEIYDDLMSINEESFGSRVVKNKKLYSLLKREGLDGIELVKGPGYFYIDSHNPKMECAINSLGGDNKIFVYSFNHQPVEVWVQDIKSLMDDIDWDYVNSLYNERPRYKLTVVNENESNNTSNKLYHQTTNDINVIKSIIKNGLIPQNKNDEGKGIWFSKEPFYDVQTTTFSIPNNDESLRKYNFDTIFDGDIKIARNFIPFNELTVENIPFAIINDNAYLFSSSKKFLMSMANKKGYNNIAEYLSNNKNFNSIVIFKDLFEKYVESGTSHIFNKYPNVKIINLFE